MRSTWNTGGGSSSSRPKATVAILIGVVAVFLLTFLASGGSGASNIAEFLAYSPDLSKPWTLLTYPFAPSILGVIWMAIWAFIFYQFASDIERRIGAAGFAVFFLVMTLLGGLCFYFGTLAFGTSAAAPSIGLVTEYIVFTWCVLNPTGQIMLMMIIPMPTRVLMWLTVAAVVVEYGWGNVPIGFLTALPMLAAWLYATDRISFLRFGRTPSIVKPAQEKKKSQEFTEFMDRVKDREKDREEKERLRKLFEQSLDDDEKRG